MNWPADAELDIVDEPEVIGDEVLEAPGAVVEGAGAVLV